jgi:signal peptidase II
VRLRELLPYAAVTVVAIALDQWVKSLVEAELPLQQMVELLPFLAFYRTYNTGVAFSLFSSVGDIGLLAVSAAVILFVLYLASRTERGNRIARLGFALIIGGALGNVIDRVAHGYVVDYILFHTPVWSFAVFNLADSLITIGAALVVIEELLIWRAGRRKAAGLSDD